MHDISLRGTEARKLELEERRRRLNALPGYHQHITSTSPAHHQHITSTSPAHHQHITSTSPAHCGARDYVFTCAPRTDSYAARRRKSLARGSHPHRSASAASDGKCSRFLIFGGGAAVTHAAPLGVTGGCHLGDSLRGGGAWSTQERGQDPPLRRSRLSACTNVARVAYRQASGSCTRGSAGERLRPIAARIPLVL